MFFIQAGEFESKERVVAAMKDNIVSNIVMGIIGIILLIFVLTEWHVSFSVLVGLS